MIIDEFFADFLGEILLGLIPKLGACVRWLFLRKKYTFSEILNQNWNGRIGVLTISIIIGTIIFLVNL